MPLEIFHTVWHRIRTSWRLATVSFVVAAVGAFILICAVGRYSSTKGKANSAPAGREIGSNNRFSAAPPYSSSYATGIVAKPSEASTLAKPRRATDEERRIMAEKLNADTQHLESLQSELKNLSLRPGDKSDTEPSGKSARSFAENYRARRELVSDLILLLTLEKRDKGDSSEIIAVRRKITRLQLELSQPPASAPRAMPVDVVENQASAEKLHLQIAICKKDILADQQELASASKPVEESPKIENIPTLGKLGTTSLPISAPFTSTEAPKESIGYTTVWQLLASAIIGSAFSLLIVLLSPESNPTIKDEATLLNALSKQGIFLGAIPRMKH